MTLLDGYDAASYRDEAIGDDGSPRAHYLPVLAALERIGVDALARRVELREVVQRSRGVTFTMRTEGAETERTFPLDLVPRIIPAPEWALLEDGLRQRVRALNLFLDDVYGEQAILRDGIVPWDMVLSSPQFQRRAWGIRPPHGVHVHVAGLDLVRGDDGDWMVLEDNLRTPSGASYVIENREVLTRVLPELFGSSPVRPVDHYPGDAAGGARGRPPRPRRATSRRSSCSRPARTTPRTSSTRSSRGTWACRSSREAICSPTATSSTCARRAGGSAST